MDVTEVKLPGVGLRYEFDLAQGDRLGVVARRSRSGTVRRQGLTAADRLSAGARPAMALVTHCSAV